MARSKSGRVVSHVADVFDISTERQPWADAKPDTTANCARDVTVQYMCCVSDGRAPQDTIRVIHPDAQQDPHQ